ncbi:type VI secretion system tip protein VgrG [Belnapia sp. T6]|uniref:Type VI secretion system tip protein VgrG n=1 Tax=Belnapia mucosa TaxID=2804532 RepID=A0ABS1V5P4_9PROT|nr:type VI secretion system tip protein TssI/VgrG [Belnapia mucosa]MBL6456927.1 type VI secretion system tip protein VgrG [Belnapia mucosa]
MAGLNQSQRMLRAKTVLGEDAVLLRRLVVSEALEQPFVIQGNLVAERDDITAAEMIGTAITCTIADHDNGTGRHFHGIISSFGSGGSRRDDLSHYRFEAVPKFWFLTRTMDCRIFQDQPVQTVIQTLIDECNVGPVTFRGMPGDPRPYCTQFNETDFDFICRLLDEAGCTYYFVHGEGSHGFTISGEPSNFPALDGITLEVRGNADKAVAVTGWSSVTVAQPGKLKTVDFDNLKPTQLTENTAPTVLPLPDEFAEALQVYRWPGGQTVRPEAGNTADLRMRRHEAAARLRTGRSQFAPLSPGHKVQITDGTGATAPWLITEVTHEAYDETRLQGMEEAGSAGYSNSFTVIPAEQAWRSPRHRPRPLVPSVQSAIVTGPSGEEIHCDAHGRVKVHFLWDHRDDKKNETSSCYIRVAQPFAGAWGGTWFLPRIGDEVLIAFLDGDPDRPVVIGSLYNADAKPPFPLPDNKTQSGIRTRSSKSESKDTANIIRLDDKKDSEEVLIHAERDMNVEVERQLKTTVGGDEVRDVVGDHKDQNTGHRTTTIKGDETLTVKEGNRTTTIKQGDDTYELSTGNLSTTIKTGNDTYKLSTGNLSQTLDKGNYDLKLSMGNMSTKLAMGNFGLKLDLGAVTIEAMQGITLKVGASEVKVDQTGVSIKGMMVKLEGTVMLEAKGLMTTVKGDAMTQVSGAIIMIG